VKSSEVRHLLRSGRVVDAERHALDSLKVNPADVEALHLLALASLQTGNNARASEWLRHAERHDPRHPLTQHYLGRLHEAEGNLGAAVTAHAEAVRRDPRLFAARLHYARSLERMGSMRLATLNYLRALQDAQAQGRWLNAATTPPALQSLVEHAVVQGRAGSRAAFEETLAPLRERYGREALSRVDRCLRIYLREDLAQSTDARQQPTFLYFPDLPPNAYLDRALFPWLDAFEAVTPDIRQELLEMLPSSAGRERVFGNDAIEQQNLRGDGVAPSWNGYYFYRYGERREDNCRSCPQTAAALDRVPLAHVRTHGPEVLFSVFTPGTHLLPHRGVTNTRLVAHLPLIVPPNCALVVGGEIHEWQEGRVVVFDDTYEHEAWNRSDQIRVVLILDIWNPHLTEPECAALAALVPAIGDFRAAVESA
jgi:aspartate beta-hydroxylase